MYKPSLLLLDEPDSHLHPNNQRALAQLLVKLATERSFQILLTTHSRHFLDELKDSADVFWFADGQIATQQFNVVQALVDLGALDTVEVFTAKKFVVLTEDSDFKPIKAIMAAVDMDLKASVFLSFSGASNLSSTFRVVEFIRQHAPDSKVIVHRDRDYDLDSEITAMITEISGSGIIALVSSGVDIESFFINAAHVAELYPEISIGDAQVMINVATLAAERKSLERIVQKRVQQAGKVTLGGINNVKILDITHSAEIEYHSSESRFRLGKSVHGHLIQDIQRVVGRHADLFRSTTALRDQLEVRQIQEKLVLP